MDEGRGENEAAGPAPTDPEIASDVKKDAHGDVKIEAVEPLPEVTSTPASTAQKVEKTKDADAETHVSAMREWLELIARAAFWALILYLFFFQVSVVEGPSMEPSFHTNDRLVIDKITYRLSKVHRFDVVVFQALETDRHAENKDYIKRVIGLPGEKVEVRAVAKEGVGLLLQVSINGVELQEPAEVDNRLNYFGHKQEFVVPPHHYFVMGDNRKDSKDSRNAGLGTLGFVPESQIRGVARLRFLPAGRWKWFWRE